MQFFDYGTAAVYSPHVLDAFGADCGVADGRLTDSLPVDGSSVGRSRLDLH